MRGLSVWLAVMGLMVLTSPGLAGVKDLACALAEGILSNMGEERGEGLKVVVASFLNEDDLSRSSPLGRVIAELLAEELHRRGFVVIEPRLTRDLFFRPGEGEMTLSREAERTYRELGVQAVVTGLVIPGRDRVVIQARLISLSDSRLLSLASVEVVGICLEPPERVRGEIPAPSVYDAVP